MLTRQHAPAAMEAMAAVLFIICLLGQPLVLAHVDGFTAVGAHISTETRSTTLRRMQLLCPPAW